jgi:hypothetical protein
MDGIPMTSTPTEDPAKKEDPKKVLEDFVPLLTGLHETRARGERALAYLHAILSRLAELEKQVAKLAAEHNGLLTEYPPAE